MNRPVEQRTRISGSGVFQPPTVETVARLKAKADATSDPDDRAAYQRAADALNDDTHEGGQR